MKKLHWIALAIFSATIILLVWASNDKPSPPAEQAQEPDTALVGGSTDEAVVQQMADWRNADVPQDLAAPEQIDALFHKLGRSQRYIDTAIARPSLKAKGMKEREAYRAKLAVIFPQLRRKYAAMLDRMLFRQNIDVASQGAKSQNLLLVGGLFASNANVEDTHNAIVEMAQRLRFSKTTFEWYEGSEGIYYGYKPLPDNAPIAAP